MPKKKESIETLIENHARATKDGFDNIDKKFDGVNRQFVTMFEGMRLMQDDINDIKRTTGPIVQMLGRQDIGIRKLEERVIRLERKAGIKM